MTPRDASMPSRTFNVRDVTVRMRRLTAQGHELASAEATLFEEALVAGWWPSADPEAAERDRLLASLLTCDAELRVHPMDIDIDDAPALDAELLVVDHAARRSSAADSSAPSHATPTTPRARPPSS